MKRSFIRCAAVSLVLGFGQGFLGCSSDDQQAEEGVQAADEDEAAVAADATPPADSAVPEATAAAPQLDEAAELTGDSAASPPAEAGVGLPEALPQTKEPVAVEVPAAAPTPAPAAVVTEAPVASSDMISYVVKAGDTVSHIARKIYGSESQWQEIAKASDLKNPDRIFPGTTLKVPVLNDNAKNYQGAKVGAVKGGTEADIVFVVKAGDTLSALAETNLGHAHLWGKIFDQNREALKDPDMLTVGQTLTFTNNEAH